MLKIQYASDLHLEFRDNTDYIMANPPEVKGDILLLAGDIMLLGNHKLESHPFFDWCSLNYKQTYIVPGNHEYYDGFELSETQADYEFMLRDNVRFLNNRSVIINDVELFFTTLWSIVPPHEIIPVQLGLTDCRRIVYNEQQFTAQDYELLHLNSLSWLKKALLKSPAVNKIVVTHHCPTTRFRDPRFATSTINSAFCVDLDNFIEDSGINTWIFGHTHNNLTENNVIGKTELLCNQMGYVKHGEHHKFRNDAVIYID